LNSYFTLAFVAPFLSLLYNEIQDCDIITQTSCHCLCSLCSRLYCSLKQFFTSYQVYVTWTRYQFT